MATVAALIGREVQNPSHTRRGWSRSLRADEEDGPSISLPLGHGRLLVEGRTGSAEGVPNNCMRNSIRALVVAVAIALILPAAVAAYWPVANRYSYVSQGFSSTHKAY